jgi:VWFA-related protein
MLWRWITVLGLLSSVWVSGAQAQQQGQAGVPAATGSTESEIATRSEDTAIKVQVNLVLVRVVVRDAGAKLVPGLKQEDFQLLDNGKRQNISTFSVETAETPGKSGAAPVVANVAGTETGKGAEGAAGTAVVRAPEMPKRFVALVFDDSHMKAADAMAVRAATKKLFASLTPTDRVAIYSTQGNVQQDFTGDAETLRKTLAAIVPHQSKGEGQYECPNISYYQADLIVNKHDQDAILAAMVDAEVNDCPVNLRATAERILQAGDLMTHESYQSLDSIVRRLTGIAGQRVLLYVSPGFVLADTVLPDSWELIERAVRSGVVVNTIDARGLYTADMMPDIAAPPQVAPYKSPTNDYQGMEGTFRMQAQFQSGQVLAEMAANTGGTYFHNRNDLDMAMSQALEAPSVSYVLGFRPQNLKADGKFHKLKVLVANGKKYQIQSRNGYYASKVLVGDAEDMAKQEVREALFSQDEIVSIPVKLKAEFFKADATSAQLTVLTQLDITGVRFRKVDGRSYDDLVLETAVFDANGQFVDGQRKEIALKLTDSTLEKMRQTGLTIKTVFTVKPGTYRARSVVRGSEEGQLTARNLVTAIPRKQTNESAKGGNGENPQWAPPKVDANLKSLSMLPLCDLPEVLGHTAANSVVLASNLEKFTAQEHIGYFMLDRSGMVEEYDSGSFQYVYSMEQKKNGGAVSREYRTPVKGSHNFPASGNDIGQAAAALIFHPDLQTDYEMKCEGIDSRNGQLDWVVHFQQRKDRPSRTAKFSVDNVAYPSMLKGRAWISKENFQVVHLEANLMGGLPDIGLDELAFTVDYELVGTPSGNLGFWLPDRVVSYWNFAAHRIILVHTLADFQLFAVETEEKIQEPKKEAGPPTPQN